MNYSEMTDFEINKAVCNAIGIDWTGANPCNSWAAAGPIIASSMISIKPVSLDSGRTRWLASKGDFGVRASDDNPRRAAMIVFLMMQDK